MGEFKNLFVLTVIVSFFLFLNIAHAGSNDIWRECTNTNIGEQRSNYICCYFSTGNRWISGSCPVGFSLSLSSTSGSVAPGGSVTITATATLSSGSANNQLLFTCNPPSGISCNIQQSSCTLTPASTSCSRSVTISTTPSTPTNTYTITIQGSIDGVTNSGTYTLTVTTQPTITLSANPPRVPVDDTSTITAMTSDSRSGVLISFSSSRSSDTFSSNSCTTDNTGRCSVTIRSSSVGSSTITGSASGYSDGSVGVIFAQITLSANPPTVGVNEGSLITAQTSDYANGVTITFETNLGSFSGDRCITGESGTCSVTFFSTTVGSATITASATGYASGSTTVYITSESPSPSIIVTAPTSGTTWQIGSTQTIGWTSTGSISNVKIELSRDNGNTWETITDSTLNDGSEQWTVTSPSTAQAKVKISDASNSNVYGESGRFTISQPSTSPPPSPSPPPSQPYVSQFEFSGDTSSFNVRWEAFYPTNPNRDMKVKCSLWNSHDGNCNPETQSCGDVRGKTCRPYDASQGTDSIKRGGCVVDSPVYAFQAENKIYCVFYDPENSNLKTIINHDFKPIDFDVRSAGKIIATVGAPVDLKIDVVNKGLLPDSYRMTLSASNPNTISITPSATNSRVISSRAVDSAIFSVVSLVDQTNEITVNVKSNTCSDCPPKEITINLQPGLLTLPEFSIFGFLQIIAIATIVYFLLLGKKK